ncbi:SCP2 domain-containing protein [Massilia sp. BJB1822]|uniref:ubiquinone anaerobic biosynthesis accessory factor UbiT n=1 Tax=Massilia sp. BJB1822 TaxID=2744470 RepID=UPI0015944CFB|nr:SCP2 sterol-binding domain-containing protein [Massilia sp. BJB1822]NVE01743.1 SCP2 sterol-binding domain-containing protein [Massilia sp. BJB1822]
MKAPVNFRLPAPVAALLGRLPPYPGSLLFVGALNLVLLRHLPEDVRQQLEGRRLRIGVSDAGVAFDFMWHGSRFQACQPGGVIDLLIAASVHDFLVLAQRREDPDTLFFSRRLQMEGNTELGLLVKNTLDAIDAPLFDPARLHPSRLFERRP